MTDKYYQKYLKYKQLYLNEKHKLSKNMKGGTMPGLSKQSINNPNFFNLTSEIFFPPNPYYDNEGHEIKYEKIDELNKYDDILNQFIAILNSDNDTFIIDSNSLYFLIARFYYSQDSELPIFINNFVNKLLWNVKFNQEIYFCFDKLENNTLIKSNEQSIYRDYNTIYDNKIILNIYARKIIPNIMKDEIEKYIHKTNIDNIYIIDYKNGEADSFMFDNIKNKSYLITQDGDIVISFLLRGNQNKDLLENTQLVLWRHEPNVNFHFFEYINRILKGNIVNYINNEPDDFDDDYDDDIDDNSNGTFADFDDPNNYDFDGGASPQKYSINTNAFKLNTIPSDFPLKILVLLLYNSTDAGYGNKMNISEIEKIIKEYNKKNNCYNYINAINMNKYAIKCKNVMKKFVATITLLLYGWGIEPQIKGAFQWVCPYIEDLIKIINQKSNNKLLCTVYPFDNIDICNLLILLKNKDDFIKLFNQELDILINYEQQLEELKKICILHKILPSMVLIYCVRKENYEICKNNYIETIKYINYISTELYSNLKLEIQKLEKIYTDNIFKNGTYTKIFNEINKYKQAIPNYMDNIDGIFGILSYLNEIFKKYNNFIESLISSGKTPYPSQNVLLKAQQTSFDNINKFLNIIIKYIDFIEYNKQDPIKECNFNTIEKKLIPINQLIIENRKNINKFITKDYHDKSKDILDVDKKVLYVPLELLIKVNESLNK